MDEPQHEDPAPTGPAVGGRPDPLLAVRAELDDITERPLTERAEVFERTHRIVLEELRALELG